MTINASKELLATLASTITIIAFLASLAMQMGEMRGAMGEMRGAMGEMRTAIEANSQAIDELRQDVRELRGIINAHLVAHAQSGVASDKEK